MLTEIYEPSDSGAFRMTISGTEEIPRNLQCAEIEPRRTLGTRLLWVCFAVATIAFWSFVGVEIRQLVIGGHHTPAQVASVVPTANTH